MKIQIDGNDIVWVTPSNYYDLARTLTCGQCFRWERISCNPNVFKGIHKNHVTLVAQESPGEPIAIMASLDDVKNIWIPYFEFDISYDDKIESLHLDPNEFAYKAWRNSRGIHILRQDLWEMIFSYIVSQRNRLDNIGTTINRISRTLSEPVKCGNQIQYPFPSAAVLQSATPEQWESFRLGYRLPYLRSMVEFVATNPDWLDSLASMTTQQAYDSLVSHNGIGPKVANCILLFGMHRTSAFPVDIWLERVIAQYYGGSLDYSRFGDLAGIIQQYMFDTIRN